jgi:DNA polymerase-3 subunit delta
MGAYIFLGPELGKKQEAVDSVKKNLKGAEEFVYYAYETPVSTIANTLQNNSLFADSRVVTVKNAEAIKKKDEIDLIVSCIKELDSNTVLILLSDENRLAAGLDDSVPKANRQIFYEMFEKDKAAWLRGFFKNEGFSVDSDCIDTILEMVENNTAALKSECSRLISFLKGSSNQGGEITADDAEKWLSRNREESVSSLFSRVAAGDISKSLESAAIMLATKERDKSARAIFIGLAWRFRKLYDYLSLVERGEAGNFNELKKIGLSAPKIRDDYIAAARRYNYDSVEACLALTTEYDVLVHSPAAAFEDILMDRYILAVIKASKV